LFVRLYSLTPSLLGSVRHSPPSSGLSVLSPNPDVPPVPESPVCPHLLHPLNVITELSVETLSKHLGVLPSLEILLPVEEPEGDLELLGGLDNGNELLDLVGGEFPRALVDVDLRLLADNVSETAAKTTDLGQGEDNVALSLDVGVEDTEDVLEFGSLH